MKVCTKCNAEKALSEFHNCSSKKDGKFSACKECRNKAGKLYADSIGHAELYRRAIERNPGAYKARRAKYYDDNKDSIKAKVRLRAATNPGLIKESRRKEYENNKEKYIARAKKWVESNQERRKQIAVKHAAKKYADPSHRPAIIARKLVSRVMEVAGIKKSGRSRTFSTLGYTKEEFESHVESLFYDGMSWDNHGLWHLDHIVPVSEMLSLGITCPKKINALKNLRPIWASENLSKSDRFELVGNIAH